LGKRSPHSYTPPSKGGRCVQHPTGNQIDLYSFTNADWVGCVDDMKSTIGASFFLGGCLVSWSSKKQSTMSLSTAEAEYIAATTCCT
jgi:hypothetical protein